MYVDRFCPLNLTTTLRDNFCYVFYYSLVILVFVKGNLYSSVRKFDSFAKYITKFPQVIYKSR